MDEKYIVADLQYSYRQLHPNSCDYQRIYVLIQALMEVYSIKMRFIHITV